MKFRNGMLWRFALLALIFSTLAHAQTTITALPAGSTIAGTEAIPMDQSGCGSGAGTCKTTPAAVATYVLAGNAATATALASSPAQCSGSQFAQGVTASGNANCATPAGGSVPAGMNVAAPLSTSSTDGDWSSYTLCTRFTGSSLLQAPSTWVFTLNISSGPLIIAAANVLQVAAGTTTPIVSTTAVTWSASGTPTLPTGIATSDPISLPVTPAYDYYISIYLGSNSTNTAAVLTTGVSQTGTFALQGAYVSGDSHAAPCGTFGSGGVGVLSVLTN
jgi:hypothetical protein